MGVKLVGCLDSETTGLPGVEADNGMPADDFVEAIQVCVVPFTYAFTQDRTYLPFKMQLKPAKFKDTPRYREAIAPAMKVNKLDIDKLRDQGIDRHKAADMFVEWWEKVTGSVQFSPLAQNFPFDRYMFIDWLGPKTFNLVFNRYYRDTYGAATFLSDKAEFDNHAAPFPDGFSLKKLCIALGISNEGEHDAMIDCIRTGAAYQKMLTHMTVPKSCVTAEDRVYEKHKIK